MSVTTKRKIETLPVAEWRKRAIEAGGGDFLNTPFKCPLCGKVSTPADFKAAGADPERAATNCIGRVIGAKGSLNSKKRPVEQPCDWAAFGLFGTLDSGMFVELEDGKTINVFSFGA